MERGNTKHGPAHDQEMAHETQRMVRGAPKPAHEEEWRQTEPVEDSLPPLRRGDGASQWPDSRDIELRSELARVLTRDLFPISQAALLARLEDSDAPADLTERLAALPKDRHRFASRHDVLDALGLSSPETRQSRETRLNRRGDQIGAAMNRTSRSRWATATTARTCLAC